MIPKSGEPVFGQDLRKPNVGGLGNST